MHISVVSLFPEMFSAVTNYGVVGRAVKNNLVEINLIDLKDYGQGGHNQLDDRPFGGGPGMVLMAEPILKCISDLKQKLTTDAPVLYLSPQGKRMQHNDVCQFLEYDELILLCGRYEGVDQRALDIIQAQEWSIGDYVLSGGELPAMVLIDAVVRQVSGVLGNAQSNLTESFSNGLLDCIHYTRPQNVRGHVVPEVLLSGNHKSIEYWRLKQSIGRTWLNRPDLLAALNLDAEQVRALEEFQDEFNNMRKC